MHKALKETTLASHFMVRFVEDQAVSVASSKHIVEPPPTNLKVFDECTVKWSDDTYKATVLSMGELSHVYLYVHVYVHSESICK